MKKDLSSGIKKVMVVYLFLILGLISYIVYFQLFQSSKIAEMPSNNRLWAKRNEVLRGTIYDRDGNALTTGEKTGDLTQTREYVYGDLYAHIIGYVDPKYGLAGLESVYDSELINYNSLSIKSFFDSFNFKESLEKRDEDKKKIGNSLKTTLDTEVQRAAYQGLGSSKGAVVALNPQTGEILASVSKPTYNPNDLDTVMAKANAGDETFPLINRVMSGMYPPGSTFKVVTETSALENIPGVADRTFKDNGKIDFGGGYSLSNSDGAVYGNIGLKKALMVSSNVVFGELAIELGNPTLKKTAEKFGFNVGIQGNGIVIDTSKFPDIPEYEKGSIAQSGIGQSSILATPMQMALVAATVANDGVMMEPNLVSQILDKNGNVVRNINPKEIRRVMSTDQANMITDAMKSAIDERVNGQWSFLRGTNTAGKTGTADYNLEDGTQATPHSWFIGFAPAENPTVAVAVIVENGGYGAGAATSVAGKVINAALAQ